MRRVIPLLAAALGAAAIAGCDRGDQQTRTAPVTRTSGKAAIGGPFSLKDQTGRPVTDRDLIGKPSLIFFGFTSCPEVCPTTLMHMSKWLKDLGPDGDKLNALYVTVDPERDTAAQIKQYLSAFDPRIRGLTGSPAAVAEIAKNYRVYYNRVPLENGSYTMDHSTMVYMMDAQGEFVGPIGYNEPDADVMPLLRDLVAGRRPISHGSGGASTPTER